MLHQNLCDRCHEREATIVYRKNVNGYETEEKLCPICAKQAGWMPAFQPEDPFEELNELFSGLFMKDNRTLQGASRCPGCGLSLSEIKAQGRFGCENCYSFFENRIDWTPFTSRSGYQGKRPEPSAKTPPEQETPEQKLAGLKKQLADAVKAEQYEQAAALRDQIRALEKKDEQKEE